MPKLTLWECDHCLLRDERSDLPSGWVFANVSNPQVFNDLQQFIWCVSCWQMFKKANGDK